MSTEPVTSIVPASDALSWEGISGVPARVEPPAPKAPAPQGPVVLQPGQPMTVGDLRTVTREEAIIDRYRLDASDKYQAAAALQVAQLERGQEIWAKMKRTRLDRGEIVDNASAAKAVTADLQNVGTLIGSILFGD